MFTQRGSFFVCLFFQMIGPDKDHAVGQAQSKNVTSQVNTSVKENGDDISSRRVRRRLLTAADPPQSRLKIRAPDRNLLSHGVNKPANFGLIPKKPPSGAWITCCWPVLFCFCYQRVVTRIKTLPQNPPTPPFACIC